MQYIIFTPQRYLILTTFSSMKWTPQQFLSYIFTIYYSRIYLVLLYIILYSLDLYFSTKVFWLEHNFLPYKNIFVTFKTSYNYTNTTPDPFNYDYPLQVHVFTDTDKITTVILLSFICIYLYSNITHSVKKYYCDVLYPYGLWHYLVGSKISSRPSSNMVIACIQIFILYNCNIASYSINTNSVIYLIDSKQS